MALNQPANSWRSLSDLPYLLGKPLVQGDIRSRPEDFKVDERLGFEPEGFGEHLFLRLRKRGMNTDWLSRRVAAVAGVPVRDVGYAGLKDRYAQTSQWFSVRLPGRDEPDWGRLETEGVELLQSGWHSRKLRRGGLQGNRFVIRVRTLIGELDDLEARLRRVREVGVPNYFGEQRFGRDYGNLTKAEQLFSGVLKKLPRHQRSIYLSSVRSQLFNEVLGCRLEQGSWNQLLDGDVLMPDEGGRLILHPADDALIRQQLEALRLHPTGPLWGEGRVLSTANVRCLEEAALSDFRGWREGLERMGLRQARRSLRAVVKALSWRWPSPDQIELSFILAAGSYATMVLRELLNVNPIRASKNGPDYP